MKPATIHIAHFSISIGVLLMIAALTGCSDEGRPTSFEPVITLRQASAITRTEAVLSAEIEWNGSPEFASFRFRYGTSQDMELTAEARITGGNTVSATLSGLTPGSTYYFCGEGTAQGSSTTIRSLTLTFDTRPNSMPALGSIKALSSGPVGLIVEFEIVSDGGEQLLGAGCDITDKATGAGSRHPLNPDMLSVGKHRIFLGGMTVGHDYSIAPFAFNSVGEVNGEPLTYTAYGAVTLESPGMLQTLIGEGYSADSLVIRGPLNGDDFHFLRLILGAPLPDGEARPDIMIHDVDLNDVHIV